MCVFALERDCVRPCVHQSIPLGLLSVKIMVTAGSVNESQKMEKRMWGKAIPNPNEMLN